jgi:hypothetical protein
MRSLVLIRLFVVLVGTTALAWMPRAAHAEQLVLFDISYEHTNANDSHHQVSGAALNQPANWTSPIDYSKGTIHFYQEVVTKPSNMVTLIDFCLIQPQDYGCIETIHYTTTGLVETVRSMAGSDVDKREVLDFTKKMSSIQLVLKNPQYVNGGSPQSAFLPSKMRFVATLVSPGGTYIRPIPTPGFAPNDGGVPDASVDRQSTPDAGTVADSARQADSALEPDATPARDAETVVDARVVPSVDAAPSEPPRPKPDAAAQPSGPPTSGGGTGSSSGCTFGGVPSSRESSLALGALFLMATALLRLRRRRR